MSSSPLGSYYIRPTDAPAGHLLALSRLVSCPPTIELPVTINTAGELWEIAKSDENGNVTVQTANLVYGKYYYKWFSASDNNVLSTIVLDDQAGNFRLEPAGDGLWTFHFGQDLVLHYDADAQFSLTFRPRTAGSSSSQQFELLPKN